MNCFISRTSYTSYIIYIKIIFTFFLPKPKRQLLNQKNVAVEDIENYTINMVLNPLRDQKMQLPSRI